MTGGTITVRPGPYLLAVNAGNGRLYAFDHRGRFLHRYGDGAAVRRAPDHEMVEMRILAGTVRGRVVGRRVEVCRSLEASEQARLLTELRQDLLRVRAATVAGLAAVDGGAAGLDRALTWMEAALNWDAATLADDGDRFRQLYRPPLGPLPPDRPQTALLQVSAERSGPAPALRDPADFQDHVRAVREFFGPDPLRRELFLAGSDAVPHAAGSLRPYFQIAQTYFPEVEQDPHGGFAIFVDSVIAAELHPLTWAELAALGLRRVFVGVNNGDSGMPPSPAGIKAAAQSLHAAGLTLGVMVSAGGTDGQGQNGATASLIRALDLGDRDTLYIIRSAPAHNGDNPPSPAQIARQINAFCRATGSVDGVNPRVVVYTPPRAAPVISQPGPGVAGACHSQPRE